MQDLLLGEDGDFVFSSDGDFLVGESDAQHIDLNLKSSKGDFRNSVKIGANLAKFYKDETPSGILNAIQSAMEADAVRIESLKITNGKINLKAKY